MFPKKDENRLARHTSSTVLISDMSRKIHSLEKKTIELNLKLMKYKKMCKFFKRQRFEQDSFSEITTIFERHTENKTFIIPNKIFNLLPKPNSPLPNCADVRKNILDNFLDNHDPEIVTTDEMLNLKCQQNSKY